MDGFPAARAHGGRLIRSLPAVALNPRWMLRKVRLWSSHTLL